MLVATEFVVSLCPLIVANPNHNHEAIGRYAATQISPAK